MEQQLQDEHSGILESHSAAHAERAREIEEIWRDEMDSVRDQHEISVQQHRNLHAERLKEMETLLRREHDAALAATHGVHTEKVNKMESMLSNVVEEIAEMDAMENADRAKRLATWLHEFVEANVENFCKPVEK